MIADLRLAFRLIVGGGRVGAARLLLMALGMAVAVTAVLMIAQLPSVIADRDETIASRAPVTGTETRHKFSYLSTQLVWQGAPLSRVFITNASDAAPAPPGIERLPRPGEVMLSPSAAELAKDARFRALIPGTIVAQISPTGLTDPAEAIAYVGVARDQISRPYPGLRWGVPTGVDDEATKQMRLLGLELAILVLPAVLIYVTACARLAAATRRRRYAALSLLGASPRSIQRVAFLEAAFAAAGGCLLGALVFTIGQGQIAHSGVLGLRWYADRHGLDTLTWLGLLATILIAARLAAWASARRATFDPIAERRSQVDRPARWWIAVPLLLGLALLLPWLPVGSPREITPLGGWLILSGTALSAIGLLLAARLLVSALAGWLAGTRLPLGPRLGAHRLVGDSSSAVRLISGLAIVVLIAGVGTGITHAAQSSAASELQPISIHVYGNEVLPNQRTAVRNLNPSGQSWLEVPSISRPTPSPDNGTVDWRIRHLGVTLTAAPCPELARLTETDVADCLPNRFYRVRSDYEDPLPAGRTIPFRTDQGRTTLRVPAATIAVATEAEAATSQLLYSGLTPPGGWLSQATFNFVVPPGLGSLEGFSTDLALVAPTATANASIDLTGVTTYRLHRAIITFGSSLAFGLGLLAALITLIDRSLERRRLVVDLVALGTSGRTIRAAQMMFAGLPFALLGTLAAITGFLIANVFAAADTGTHQWLWSPLSAQLPLLVAGLVISLVAGLITIGLTPRAEDFRRE